MTHSLNQFSVRLGIAKPKKEVHTQSRNQAIFLQSRQIFVNSGQTRFELVAVTVRQDFTKKLSAS